MAGPRRVFIKFLGDNRTARNANFGRDNARRVLNVPARGLCIRAATKMYLYVVRIK